MENQEKPCYNCQYLDRFYTKEVKRFQKTNFGFCTRSRTIVESHGTCEKYCRRPGYRYCNLTVKRTLEVLLTEISAIRQVIEEENNENEEHEKNKKL